jgi:zinc transport system ATP-binding protein
VSSRSCRKGCALSSPDSAILIRADAVCFAREGQTILDRVSLAVHAGEIVTLIGPNGAGKTSLLKILLGLHPPTEGQLWRRPGLRIGYMPQRLQLDPTLPLTVARYLSLWSKVGTRAMLDCLEETGAAHLFERSMHSLSGGEAQRVHLARALLRQPDLLALDEPVQAVDVHGQAQLFHLIDAIRRRRGCGVALVSHDLHLVMARTDTVICLNRHVCCHGRPDHVSRHPDFLALFGEDAADLAMYRHHHDHAHGDDGCIVAPAPRQHEAHDHG